MASLKFLHTADLHLDSPLRGLESYPGAPVDRIRSATRDAFENIVALAIREQVQFVIIAGDLFDRGWTGIDTGLWTAQQFRKLERHEIRVFLLRGNHDALSEVPQRMQWPGNVFEFSSQSPSTFEIDGCVAVLHGQGFATREVPENLAACYPAPVPGRFNIGVLHTSLTGYPTHDTYAPTSADALARHGYDYWALGHIHQFQRLSTSPPILFPGCPQGRHIQEAGAKGCVIVHVEGAHIDCEFHEVDTLRWGTLELMLEQQWTLSDVYEAVRAGLQEMLETAAGRFLAVRVVLKGQSACHQNFSTIEGSEEATLEIRNLANTLPDVWVEKVVFETLPDLDLEQLAAGHDLIGEIVREFSRLKTAHPDEFESLFENLTPLSRKVGTELRDADFDLRDPARLRNWLKQAEAMVLSMLLEQGQSG